MKIEIEKLDHFARGITKIGEKICFVENALPNEIVEIDNIKEKKKYFEASTKHIIKESKDRIKTLCKYYNICGGCNIEHLNYEVENGNISYSWDICNEKCLECDGDRENNCTKCNEINYFKLYEEKNNINNFKCYELKERNNYFIYEENYIKYLKKC